MQLKRRHDLIPNLVQVVKDAMAYEQETLTKVIQARNNAVARPEPAQSGPAEAALSQATHGLLALMENYPQLKAQRQRHAAPGGTHGDREQDRLARQFYNDSVNTYNTPARASPRCWPRRRWASVRWTCFNMPEGEREVPKSRCADG